MMVKTSAYGVIFVEKFYVKQASDIKKQDKKVRFKVKLQRAQGFSEIDNWQSTNSHLHLTVQKISVYKTNLWLLYNNEF